jgi:hypothetical protein
MTVAHVDGPDPAPDDAAWLWIRSRLERDRRLLRTLTQAFVEELMAVEVESRCWGSDGERINRRNGYRHVLFETSYGSISVRVPKLRQGGYAPPWLSERPDGTDDILIDALCRGYVEGMSSELVAMLIDAIGVDGISADQHATIVDAMNARIDAQLARPLLDVHGDDVVIETLGPTDASGAMSVASTSVNGEHEVLSFFIDGPDAASTERQLEHDLTARGVRGEIHPSAPRSSGRRAPAVTIVVRRHGRGADEAYDELDDEPHRRGSRRRLPLLLAAVAVLVLIAAVVVGTSAAQRQGPDRDPAPPPATTSSAVPTSAPVTSAAPTTAVTSSAPTTTAPAPVSANAAAASSADCAGAGTDQRVPWMDQVLCEAATG